jgi:hypothetical protein
LGITVNDGTGFVVLKDIHITGPVLNENFGITVNSVGSLTIDHVTITNTQFGVHATNGFALGENSLVEGTTYAAADYGDNMYKRQSTINGKDC